MDEDDDTAGFAGLQLSPAMLDCLKRRGFVAPTPIQSAAIPLALRGVDVIGGAQTGTGKTAAFLIPVIERLALQQATRALVLAPTRELAEQIEDEARAWCGGAAVDTALVVGGVGKEAQERALAAGARLVVATPGRLLDFADRDARLLLSFDVLVIDEADRMLDLGFEPQLTRILAMLPAQRQTLLFSATIGPDVDRFAATGLIEPARVLVDPFGSVARGATQAVYFAAAIDKVPLLLCLLHEIKGRTLVFTRTRQRAERVLRWLRSARIRSDRIHAERTTTQRKEALDRFERGSIRVLVATNVAARGLDLEGIDHVINFDVPEVPEDYVHRIGRTARMERSGAASTLVAPDEHPLLHRIERLTREPIACRTLPDLARARATLRRPQSSSAGRRPGSRPQPAGGKLSETVRRHASGKRKRRLKTKLKAKRRRQA